MRAFPAAPRISHARPGPVGHEGNVFETMAIARGDRGYARGRSGGGER
jgi:hypothetical protein